MIENLLREIGLTEYETKIYLALLELGESTSGIIMNKSNVRSGRIYQILDSLKEKGLISEIIKNKIKYFSATDPKKILAYLDEKEGKIKKQKEEVASILPEILSKINSQDKSAKIEIYTGFEGMKSAFMKETTKYKKNAEVCVLGIKRIDFYPKKIIDFFEFSIYPKRISKNIIVRKINDPDFKKVPDSKEDNAKIRYLDYPSTTTITICEDLTILAINTENPVVITIESEDVAKAFKTQFDALWKIAKA